MNTRLGHIAITCGLVAIVLLACGGTEGAVADGGVLPPPEARDGGVEAGVDAETADASTADATDGDAAAHADGDAADAAPKDDPCPPKLDANCSTSCGGPAECSSSQVGCSLALTAGYVVPDDDFPFVVRTPSSPASLTPGGTPPQCANTCTGTVWYGLHFRVVTTTQPQLRVRVQPPWFVSHAASTAAACSTRAACASVTLGTNPIVPLVVATTDPNAPARNIVIEATSDPCTP